MKKSIALLLLSLITGCFGFSQNPQLDKIRQDLANASSDTSRVLLLAKMCNTYKFDRPDSALYYGYNALMLAKKIKFPKGEVQSINLIAITELTLGNITKALHLLLNGSKIAEENNLVYEKSLTKLGMGFYYSNIKDYSKALSLIKESYMFFDSIGDIAFSSMSLNSIGEIFLLMNQPDSAFKYCKQAYDKSIQIEGNWATTYILLNLGKLYDRKGNTDLALSYFRKSLSKASNINEFYSSSMAIAQLYKQSGLPDSSVFYAKKSLNIALDNGFYQNIIKASLLLSDIYETKDIQQAFQYSRQAIIFKDSLTNLQRNASKESFEEFDRHERQQEIDAAKIDFQNRLRINALSGITFTLLVIAFFLYRNNRLKQKAKQNIELAYNQLKSTQAQLIQSEKMASFGELTAGIAHEIQNPLNFVNNFSEVSNELIDEMKEEQAAGNWQLATEIADDIKQNLEKINHHGKRAADIVKGMLQHSRTSSGQKEPTDINALADEYLRLAYHGLRAKDKSFNADFKTDFDPTLPKINVIPQDIGRVLLNLINNAFYAVTEQSKLFQSSELWKSYQPLVAVSTINLGDKIQISVKDNGPGIPAHIVDKIFQPFFTTKPTGQGTGLGLSLSYDIIKAHGGVLKVETKEGEETEFILILSI
jgi:signal transduction histidine kinase